MRFFKSVANQHISSFYKKEIHELGITSHRLQDVQVLRLFGGDDNTRRFARVWYLLYAFLVWRALPPQLVFFFCFLFRSTFAQGRSSPWSALLCGC